MKVLALPAVLPEVRGQVHQLHHLGFGERPIRSLLMSMGVILLATLTYFLAPESVTHGHLGRSSISASSPS
jgi:hypothetical protein